MGNCWANLCRVNQKQNLPKQEPKQKPQKLVVIKRPAEKEFESRYELGRELKRAEFGTTYFCKDRNTGEKFACKSIPKNKLITSILIEDVRREVAILSHLRKHPNIISLKDIYEDEDHVHLIMELCRGGDLLPNIGARGHYGERAAASVIKTVVQVVQMCHEHGVMLRNLKPENIFFANNMESAPIKVTDFHFSIFFEPGERFNEIVGSPHHMAPEMLKRNYGPEIDIWSAGIILYVLLCGPVPRNWAETEEGYAQTFMQWVLDFKREPWRKVSDNAKDLVKKMLDSDPKCRLTAQEVLDHPWLKNPTTTLDVSFEETVSYEYEAWTLTRVSDMRWTLQHR